MRTSTTDDWTSEGQEGLCADPGFAVLISLPPCLTPLLQLSLRTSSLVTLTTSYQHTEAMGPKPLWKVLSPVNSQASSSTRLRDRLNEILAEPIKPVVTINDSFKLRDFQADAIDAVLHALVNDKLTSIGVSAPAGSGKTTIFTTLIPLIPEGDKGNKVLIIVPSVVLIAQTENVIRERYPKRYQIGFEQGERSTHSDDDM